MPQFRSLLAPSQPLIQCRWLLLVGVLHGAQQGAAQARLQVTPYVVGHLPILNYNRVIGTNGYIGDFKQTMAPGFGGKVTYWASRDFAAEIDVSYVSSGTRVRPDSLSDGLKAFGDDGYQVNAIAFLVYRPIRTNLLLGFGLGYVHRGGDAWRDNLLAVDSKFNRSNLTTALSLGALVHLGSGLAIRPSVEGLVYWVRKFDPGERAFNRPREMQADLQVKVGIPIGL